MRRFLFASLLTGICVVAGIYHCHEVQDSRLSTTFFPVSVGMTLIDTSGFDLVDRPRTFAFPQDFGPHFNYQLEWWYYSGNLKSAESRDFGFQFTIFRFGIAPEPTERESNWGIHMFYFAHFTITDIANNRFYFFDRFSRANNQLAGARSDPYKVWVEDWSVKGEKMDKQSGIPQMEITAKENDIALNVMLINQKPVVLQGDDGLSKKGPNPGHASYYFSLPRLETKGTIRLGDQTYEVTGTSWMDKEWSTSALHENQIGWDWFSLQLHDGREIMYYQLRGKNNSVDPFSQGTIIQKDGISKRFTSSDIDLTILDYWQSPFGGTYPSKWKMRIPDENIELHIEPRVANQELNLFVRYWEGSVNVEGHFQDDSVTGNGYVELTGYATRFPGK